MKIRFFFFLLVFSGLLSSKAFGINLDGILNDPEWAEATLSTDFITVSPYTLEQPEHRTEARIYSNDEGIYIGITNFQPLATQQTDRTARDAEIKADSNTIIIDFDNTAISAYQFEVGNGGSMRDGIWRNETSFNNEWNGLWSVQTSNDDDHWYAEVYIPWDVAPMVAVENGERTIGLLYSRSVVDNSKQYSNEPINDDRIRFMSEFSNATIKDFSGSSLQVFAYATARQDRVADENTYDAGADIFWKPNSSKQLSLSINPDYGQVESDDLVVNFSPTETFFSENRPFFTENQAIFDLSGANGLRVLHTRRIGGQPDVGDEVEAGILAALKFTSVGEKFNYGFLTAAEDSDDVAEGRNYFAGRAIRKTDDYSIGYLLTYADRPDIDRDAIVHTVDFSYNFTENVQTNGQIINTNIHTLDDEYSDNGGWFSVDHQITDTWNQSMQASYYGDEFEVNDFGFLGRNNLQTFNYSMGLQNFVYAEKSIILSHENTISVEHEENTQGVHLNSSISLNDGWNFKNTSNGFANLSVNSGGTDDLITRGNNYLNTDSGANLNIIYFADRRNKFQWHLRGNYFNNTVQGQGYFVHFHPSYQFNDKFLLRTGFTYTDSEDWLLWQGGNRLNAYDQERLLTEVVFTANFSEKQEFSLKFEWIALEATGQQAYRVNGVGDLDNLGLPVDNFNLSDVAIQLHYRYEIAPLSNIYVVYSRGGRAIIDDASSFDDLFSPGWDARDGDNFIVKVRYQF